MGQQHHPKQHRTKRGEERKQHHPEGAGGTTTKIFLTKHHATLLSSLSGEGGRTRQHHRRGGRGESSTTRTCFWKQRGPQKKHISLENEVARPILIQVTGWTAARGGGKTTNEMETISRYCFFSLIFQTCFIQCNQITSNSTSLKIHLLLSQITLYVVQFIKLNSIKNHWYKNYINPIKLKYIQFTAVELNRFEFKK